MRTKILLIALFSIVLGGCSATKNATKGLSGLEKEAMEFSLSIVEAYFDEDCDKVLGAMSDTLLLMDGDGQFPKTKVEEKGCRSVKKAIRNKEKSFKDYLATYRLEILSQAALERKFNTTLPDYFGGEETNFFFLGREMKEEAANAEDFIWDDMFVFMVSKQAGKWVLRGLSG